MIMFQVLSLLIILSVEEGASPRAEISLFDEVPQDKAALQDEPTKPCDFPTEGMFYRVPRNTCC